MAIAMNLLGGGDLLVDERGQRRRVESFAATGLTAGASNAAPHGLPHRPRRVWFTAVGNAALATPPSLDTSQGDADPTGSLPGGKLGMDATNIYIIMPAGETVALVNVEW